MAGEIACTVCPLGRASGMGQGQFCPLIVREHERGHVLHRRGDAATYVWFVKSGEIETEWPDGRKERQGPGSFVGLESLLGDRHGTMSRSATHAFLCGATREGFLQWLGPQHERLCAVLRAALGQPARVHEPSRTARGDDTRGGDDAPEDHLPGDRTHRGDRL